MDDVGLNSFFTTTRSFSKFVISATREMIQVPANQLAIDHFPSNGERRGILVEQASTNLFPDSENLTSGVTLSGGSTVNTTPIAGSPRSALVPSGGTISCNQSFTASTMAVSFFCRLEGGGTPSLGNAELNTGSFFITLNGSSFPKGEADIAIEGPMADGSYRVRVKADTFIDTVNNFSITARTPLRISRIQIESQCWTSYIPTTGTPQSRAAETVFRDLVHGREFNQDQGTVDVRFTATPGSNGAPLTLLKPDWTEYISVGRQNGSSSEIVRFHSASNQFDNHTCFDMLGVIRNPNTRIRLSWSGYGVRAILLSDGSGRVEHLKDYDSFMSGKLSRIQFGETYNGEQFSGHIHAIQMYARTFNNDEMTSA